MITQILPKQILDEPKHTEKKLQTNDIIFKFYNTGFTKESEKIKQCGNYLEFIFKEHQITKENKKKLANANFCKNRFCPVCSWRRTRNITGQLKEAFTAIQEKEKIATLFLTLTVNNPDVKDLKDTIAKMNKAFKRMSETKRFKNAILGYFKSIEILGDKTPKGQAHPHFHILLVVKENYFKKSDYINQKEFLQMWRDATRNQNITQVDIRIIKPNKDKNATASAVAEMCKYPLKDTDISKLTSEQFEKFVLQLKGIRNINAGGNLKNILKGTEKMDNDLVHIDDEHNDQLWILLKKLLYEYRNEKGSTNFYLKEKSNNQNKEK